MVAPPVKKGSDESRYTAHISAMLPGEYFRLTRILTTAALLEQPFDPESLAALLDTDPGTLTEELEQFCARRILRVDGLRFRFRYAIVRNVLVESISPARRRLVLRRLHMTEAEDSSEQRLGFAETAR